MYQGAIAVLVSITVLASALVWKVAISRLRSGRALAPFERATARPVERHRLSAGRAGLLPLSFARTHGAA